MSSNLHQGTRPQSLHAQRPFPARRPSANVFAACLGIWLPKSEGAVLVDLDATALSEGPLQTWTNKGTVVGNFIAAGTAVPQVATVQGAKGVSFLGGTAGAAGTHYQGPAAPAEV